MTYQSPPPPGSPYPPGPPGGFPPPGGGKPAFDPKSVNPLDWAIAGLALLAFIFSFVKYYTASFDGGEFIGKVEGHVNGWHGLTWFVPLAALVIIGLLVVELAVPSVKLPVPGRLVILVLWGVSLLTVLLGLVWVPIDTGPIDDGIDKGHGIGYWLTLIVVIAGVALSVMRLKATGGSLPWENRPAAGQGQVPQGYQQPGVPGGFPPPAAPGGYAPPAPPAAPGGFPPPPPVPPAPGGYPPPPPAGPAQ